MPHYPDMHFNPSSDYKIWGRKIWIVYMNGKNLSREGHTTTEPFFELLQVRSIFKIRPRSQPEIMIISILTKNLVKQLNSYYDNFIIAIFMI